jgi:hypothetical protein
LQWKERGSYKRRDKRKNKPKSERRGGGIEKLERELENISFIDHERYVFNN